MTDDDYSNAEVIKNPWPTWVSMADGSWQRQWIFELERPVSDGSLEGRLRLPSLAVQAVRLKSPNELEMTVSTTDNPWSDAIFFTAMYRLFQGVEEAFGQIKSIQGQPRNMWRPYRQ